MEPTSTSNRSETELADLSTRDPQSNTVPLQSPYAQKLNAYTWFCSTFVVVGSLLYGIDSGIVSTTISHEQFKDYFAPFTSSIKGAVVSTFSGGAFFGVFFSAWAADKWGRKRTIMFAACWAVVAGIIQAASVKVGMLIAGRIIGGFAVGIMNMVIPVYNSEIAPTSKRGLITGLHGQFVGFGFAAANWIGFGCSYSNTSFQWRFPLAFQCVPALILLCGLPFLPYSPRWLLEKDRAEEAYAILRRLHGENNLANPAYQRYFDDEFEQMKEQIRYEHVLKSGTMKNLLSKPSNRKRLLLSIAIQVFAQLSGINVVNYYQTDIYEGVGITGHTVTLLASLYGMVGPAFNMLCISYVDRFGRRSALYITGVAMAADLAIVMALTANYSGTDNKVGQGFAIAFIFLFTAIYSLGYNSIHYIYVPEIMNQEVRAKGTAVAVCCNVIVNIIFNQISPIGFANIGFKYYGVFIALNCVGAIIVYFYFPETKGKSLEEINEIFGEEVVTSQFGLEEMGKVDHRDGAQAQHRE
ncbi:general substrate transporter [Myxozyma melibiosi]|uniref:General substrate transporter n=1 Tax=Myxozyma melibiosi TaxID=54550 RepID=A0ABR1F4Y8_9ASCO